ncbi:MAG: hypothetical protein V4719_27980 [Planctomycetota bacterium]
MSLPSRSLAWSCRFVCCLVLQFWAELACAAPPVTEEVLAQRRKAIASLSGTQRQELVRKYEQYQQLGEGERQKLQSLHDDMAAEPDLKLVMQKYCDWVSKLEPTQREELRQAKTPEQKRNLVVRFHQAQKKRKEEVWRNLIPQLPENRALPVLKSDELKEVMTALEAALDKDEILNPTIRAELAQTTGTRHYSLLMSALGEYRHPDGGPVRDFEVPEAVRTKLIQIVRKRDDRPELFRAAERQKMPRPFFGVLLRSTVEEARREFYGSGANELKEAIFHSMPPERQARFSQAPASEHDMMLMRTHLNEIWRAFAAAGDLPRPPGEGNPRGRGNEAPPLFRNPEGNRAPRPAQERVPDGPPNGRRPKVE